MLQNVAYRPTVYRIGAWVMVFSTDYGRPERKYIFRNMSQGLPNPGFMQEKIQKGDFL
jgi:hypothetical protein